MNDETIKYNGTNINIQDNYNIYEIYKDIPYGVINDAIGGIDTTEYQTDVGLISKYYNIYNKGAAFVSEGSKGDYIPAKLRFRKAANLINKEARFMFSIAPEFIVEPDILGEKNKSVDDSITTLQTYVNKVLSKSMFEKNIIKSAKDCLIGKRIAIMVNFNEKTGVTLNYLNSLSFMHFIDGNDELYKFVSFTTITNAIQNNDKRILVKVYTKDNDIVYMTEKLYDGAGRVVEEISIDQKLDIDFIPVVVIQNEGLLGDDNGESEVQEVYESESWYSKLANADIDAGRKGMNPIRYTVDMDSESTEKLSSSAGSYWDLHSDQNLETSSPSVGMINVDMGYTEPLNNTLKRIKQDMHEQLEIPDINKEMMQGTITSGKTIEALYWPLIVRCNEKLTSWLPELKRMIKMIIEGSKVYTDIAKLTMPDIVLADIEYKVNTNVAYPIPENKEKERANDMDEVVSSIMSKKRYLVKWKGLTDDEADNELLQLIKEKNMFDTVEGSYEMDDIEGEELKDEELEEDNMKDKKLS